MDGYKIKVTRQAKEHLALIREYIAKPYRVKCIDEQPWGELGFRKIRVKNYYVYFWVDENKREVQILAVIYVRRDQATQLEQL